MRPGIAAVAFDLDGTLYPNYRLYIRLLPFIFKEWRLLYAFARARNLLHADTQGGNKSTSPDAGQPCTKDNYYQRQAALTAGFWGAQPDETQNIIETRIYRGWEPHFTKIKLYPHVFKTLNAFRKAGLKMGLLSDFPPETKIKHLGIDACWDAVLCTERAGGLKPDPLSFVQLAQALNTDPARILYVGNSFKYDIVGAKRAGMQAALIARCRDAGRSVSQGTGASNRIKPDFVFRDYRQLYDYVLG